MRSQDSINLGLEIIKDKIIQYGWEVDIVKYGDIINVDKYDIIGFNIFYVTQQLNLNPFLVDNNIEPLLEKRKERPLLIAGGQGVQNPLPISNMIDIFVIGDGEDLIEKILHNYENNSLESMKNGKGIYYSKYAPGGITFNRLDVIDSIPVINGKKAMIELNRGCKHRCKFCQYGWSSGKYREKDIELVKKQILNVKNKGANNINLLSCNIGGYSKIEELLQFCIDQKVRLMNTDIRIDEYSKIAKYLDILKVRTLKVGLESFTEKVRYDANKKISDKQLEEFFDLAIQHNISNFHFYLIYGLPTEENYNRWFYYLKYFKDKIATVGRSVRLEYSIMNFEPSLFTPYEKEKFIDFDEKHKFLKEFLKVLEEIGTIKEADKMWYGNMSGRLGRKPNPYDLTMKLLHGDQDIGNTLLQINKGATRSIKDNYYEKFIRLNNSNLKEGIMI